MIKGYGAPDTRALQTLLDLEWSEGNRACGVKLISSQVRSAESLVWDLILLGLESCEVWRAPDVRSHLTSSWIVWGLKSPWCEVSPYFVMSRVRSAESLVWGLTLLGFESCEVCRAPGISSHIAWFWVVWGLQSPWCQLSPCLISSRVRSAEPMVWALTLLDLESWEVCRVPGVRSHLAWSRVVWGLQSPWCQLSPCLISSRVRSAEPLVVRATILVKPIPWSSSEWSSSAPSCSGISPDMNRHFPVQRNNYLYIIFIQFLFIILWNA